MAVYAVGDIQGCYQPLRAGLEKLNFNPIEDTLYCLGDMVNRGPQSGDTLRYLMDQGSAVRPILGNHDLSLLVAAEGIKDCVDPLTREQIIDAPDADILLQWIRQQPLARYDDELDALFLHAGLYPHWSAVNAMEMSNHFTRQLQDPRPEKYHKCLAKLFGNKPSIWSETLGKRKKNRFIVNAFTRMRYLTTSMALNYDCKVGPDDYSNSDLIPWFNVPNPTLHNTRVFFGHWAALGLYQSPHFYGLDTGCVWGNTLTFARIEPQNVSFVLQVPAETQINPLSFA